MEGCLGLVAAFAVVDLLVDSDCDLVCVVVNPGCK